MQRKKVQSASDDRREYFIFEIGNWRPTFSIGVDYDKCCSSPFREHAGIELEAVAVFPARVVGRTVTVSIMGERDWFMPASFRLDPKWKPLGIASLEFTLEDGHLYASVPHESLPFLASCIAHQGFRFVSAWGPPLKRNRSVSLEFRLMNSFDPEEY